MPTVIQLGFAEAQRLEAAQLYGEAFARKLQPILGSAETRTRLLAAGLNPQCAFTAQTGGQLVGLAGFHHAGRHLVNPPYSMFTQEFGWVGGWGRLALGALLSRTPKRGELLMDGITIHAEVRGQGIGSQLLNALSQFGVEHGYHYIRLEVIDTNLRAQQLYERLGFQAVATHHYPWIKNLFGFSAVTTMHKPLGVHSY
jgi:ribosomal protein S18 acetylase RimI-like enzyme